MAAGAPRLRSLRAEKRSLSAWDKYELPEILYQARPVSAGHHAVGLYSLQYSRIAVVVGWQETSRQRVILTELSLIE